MRPRTVVAVLVAALAVYLLLVGWRGVVLVTDGVAAGDVVGVVLGASVLVFPVVGAWLVWREIRFGRDTQALAASLADRGALPPDDLPRRPSGRVDRDAARAAFDEAHAHTAAHPDDPAAWYRLGLAYDDLGDRRQARAAVRRAIQVWRSADASGAQ